MVQLSTAVSVIAGFVAAASAMPTALETLAVLEGRDDVSCREDLGSAAYGHAADAVWCINYLASLGDQACVSSVSAVIFCEHGDIQIRGQSRDGRNGATSSCQNVARGAGQIMDRCTTAAADGSLWVKGQAYAWGNGDLIVHVRSNGGI